MTRKENTTLGALKEKREYAPQTIQEEMAQNLREQLQERKKFNIRRLNWI